MKTMRVRLWMHSPFAKVARKTFELPVWPYDEESVQEFDEWMDRLTIFRYEDDVLEDENGRDINYAISRVPEEGFEFPFMAFYQELFILNDPDAAEEDDLKVIAWPEGFLDPRMVKKLEECPTRGDMMAWNSFNVIGTCHALSASAIKFETDMSTVETINCNQSCRYADGTIKKDEDSE